MRCNANSLDQRRRSDCHRLKIRKFSLIHRAMRFCVSYAMLDTHFSRKFSTMNVYIHPNDNKYENLLGPHSHATNAKYIRGRAVLVCRETRMRVLFAGVCVGSDDKLW